MAREIKDIKKELEDAFVSDSTIQTVYELDAGKSFSEQFSKVSIEAILLYVVAVSQWTLEKLFDLHRKDVKDIIDRMKPHSMRWYVNMAKAFQYGDSLVDEEDYYENSGLSEDEISERQIVTNAAVSEIDTGLRLKVAASDGDSLRQLDGNELTAFRGYMAEVKDAGVRLDVTSDEADHLSLELTIYYDPQILDGSGSRISDGSEPVKDAIYGYLKNLPFNGWFVRAYFIDALQEVEGVVIPELRSAKAWYGSVSPDDVGVKYNPDAGYLKIYDEEEDLDIKYKAQGEIR